MSTSYKSEAFGYSRVSRKTEKSDLPQRESWNLRDVFEEKTNVIQAREPEGH